MGRDPGSEDRAQHDREEDRGAAHAPLETPEPSPAAARERGRRGGFEARRADGGVGADGHQPARMRGSISPTIRSTIAFTITMMRASRTTAHCTTGKSWLRIESTVSVATPGQAKT